MTSANKWLIALVNRLHETFPQCGFAYSYEADAEQHIVELSSADTLLSDDFCLNAGNEVNLFGIEFPNECILFIDMNDSFPIEPPILYRVQPIVKKSWFENGEKQKTTQVSYSGAYLSVTLQDMAVNPTSDCTVCMMPTVLVNTNAFQIAQPSYAMAA